MPTLIHERVRACRAGRNPRTVARTTAGWVVMGDVQFVRGYCLLLPDPVVPDLNALAMDDRLGFLGEWSVLGDVLLEVTGCLRINYEILGNLEPALHAHTFPRYGDEPRELRTRPVWHYDWDAAPSFDAGRDRPLMEAIAAGLRERGLARI